jgi:hypothetical protein
MVHECGRVFQRGKEPESTLVLESPMGRAGRSMLSGSSARRARTTAEERTDTTATTIDANNNAASAWTRLPSASSAMCVVGATTTGAREPVCVHRNAPDERAGATHAHPCPGVCLDLAKRSNNFLGNGVELWLTLGPGHRGSSRMSLGRARARFSRCLIALPRDVVQISNHDPLSWHCSVGNQETTW